MVVVEFVLRKYDESGRSRWGYHRIGWGLELCGIGSLSPLHWWQAWQIQAIVDRMSVPSNFVDCCVLQFFWCYKKGRHFNAKRSKGEKSEFEIKLERMEEKADSPQASLSVLANFHTDIPAQLRMNNHRQNNLCSEELPGQLSRSF